MSVRNRKTILAALAATAALLYQGCNDSNDVAGPATGNASMDVTGSWSGVYQSDDASLCANATASATLSQTGTTVTGSFRVAGCGIGGAFRGFMDGNQLTGSVNMAGCTGGAVSATMGASGLRFRVGEFTKTLVGGDREVMSGGTVTLQR